MSATVYGIIRLARGHQPAERAAFELECIHGAASASRLPMLKPKLDVLPSRQRLLWSQLGSTPRDFVLYGGTALALRLGHRESIDFDFFSCRPFEPLTLLRAIPYLQDQAVTQQAESTLSCEVATAEGMVKISFFGGLSLRQLAVPDLAEGNGIPVASLVDLFGTKCVTVTQRNEVKDYIDIHTLLTEARLDLSMGIAAARAIYGVQYDPLMTLQALTYFEDLGTPLDAAIMAVLREAVCGIVLQDLPVLHASTTIGSGIDDK